MIQKQCKCKKWKNTFIKNRKFIACGQPNEMTPKSRNHFTPGLVHITCLVMIEKEVRKYLDKGGFLSDAIDEFEHRPQQIAMAEAVGRVFDREHHLIVEAGTGTGKSLAYLIPAILWAVQHNKKVVVSTYSTALQEPLLYHDIPLIHE